VCNAEVASYHPKKREVSAVSYITARQGRLTGFYVTDFKEIDRRVNSLVLDEPVATLNVRDQIEMMDLVLRISRGHDAFVLIILYDISLAAKYCDAVVALKAGRVAFQSLVSPYCRRKSW
jgi:ABC-type hemin transport system ATPase subunit